METLLGMTFSTDEQVVMQNITFRRKWSSHLSRNSTRQSIKSSSLLAPRTLGHSSTSRSPRMSALKSLRRLPRRWPAQRASFLVASRARPAVTSPTRPARPMSLKANLVTPFSFSAPGYRGSQQPVKRNWNAERQQRRAHVDNRCKKLEQLSI